MNRNRLKLLLALAAALVASGCGPAAEKSGRDGAAAASAVNAPDPAPPAHSAANVSAAGAPAASTPPPPGATQPGSPRGTRNAPPPAVPTPRIGSGGNDLFLFTQARAALNSDAELGAANLTLDVKDGVVTLSGTVANAALRARAEELVRGAGPRTVRNQLRVGAGH